MVAHGVDLRSDTVTQPTEGMRRAMAAAEVGDDVFGEDPTVNRLEQRVAELLGHEAALFVPSGTMANQLAVRSQTQPGDEVLLERDGHIFNHESGAAAVLSGVLLRQLEGVAGVITARQVADALRPPDNHHAPPTLVTIENTHNLAGGTVFPLETLKELRQETRARGLALHIDGARIFNAAAAEGVSAAEYGRQCDTISCCFSKGLGAPVGSALAGSAAVIRRARRMRKMLGGGMRQAGILAAGALYALEHHVDRLAEDHARARRLANTLGGLEGFTVANDPPPTNILMVEVAPPRSAGELREQLEERGVRVLSIGPSRMRLVVHLEIGDEELALAEEAFRQLAQVGM